MYQTQAVFCASEKMQKFTMDYPELNNLIETQQDRLTGLQYDLVENLFERELEELEARMEEIRQIEKHLELAYELSNSIYYNFKRFEERELMEFARQEAKKAAKDGD